VVSGGPGGGGGGGLRAAGLRTTFLALTFLAGAFLTIFFAAVFLTDPFLAAAFFIGLFLAIALRAVFLTAPFFAVAFFAALFFAAAFLAGFLVVAFTMFKIPLLFLADWFKMPTRGLHSVPLLISRARGVASHATQMSATRASKNAVGRVHFDEAAPVWLDEIVARERPAARETWTPTRFDQARLAGVTRLFSSTFADSKTYYI
jgi:hypothetical protein